MYSKLVVGLVLLIALFNLTVCDDATEVTDAQKKAYFNTTNNSTVGPDLTDWTVLRTSYNNELVGNIIKRQLKWTPASDPRPSPVSLRIDISLYADSECKTTYVNGSITYGIRVDPDAGSCNGSVIGLYDVLGYIAGLQVRIPYNESRDIKNNTYDYFANGLFFTENINGTLYFVLTAYFVDTKTICTTGRNSTVVIGTGDRLLFQNGPNPEINFMTAPKNRTDAPGQNWTTNNCFPGMGLHNFNNVESWNATQCRQLVPVFLLYNNNGRLIGYGWDWVGKSVNKRMEQPPVLAIQTIMGTVPKCLTDYAQGVGVTTLHVFFVQGDPGCLIIKTFIGAVVEEIHKVWSWLFGWLSD